MNHIKLGREINGELEPPVHKFDLAVGGLGDMRNYWSHGDL